MTFNTNNEVAHTNVIALHQGWPSNLKLMPSIQLRDGPPSSSARSLKIILLLYFVGKTWTFLISNSLKSNFASSPLELDFHNAYKERSKGWKHEIKSHKMCGQFFLTIFWIFEKSPWEHYTWKKKNVYFLKQLSYYTFKVVTKNISWKFSMFQEFFHMFKAPNKSMWTSGFFCFKSPFSLSNVH
jgi:hypothetical protein